MSSTSLYDVYNYLKKIESNIQVLNEKCVSLPQKFPSDI